MLSALAASVWHDGCCCREEVDRGLDERLHEAEILAEVSELQAESREEHERKVAEYKKQHEEWKTWKKKQVCSFSTFNLGEANSFLSRTNNNQ